MTLCAFSYFYATSQKARPHGGAILIVAAMFAMVFAVVLVFFAAMIVVLIVVTVIVLHKIHGLVAGVVLVAMLGPFFRMARGHVHVDGGLLHDHRRLGDDDRLRVNHHRRWGIAYHYAAVHARLNYATDGHTDVGLRMRDARYRG